MSTNWLHKSDYIHVPMLYCTLPSYAPPRLLALAIYSGGINYNKKGECSKTVLNFKGKGASLIGTPPPEEEEEEASCNDPARPSSLLNYDNFPSKNGKGEGKK